VSKRFSTDSIKLNVGGDTRFQSKTSRPVSVLGPKPTEPRLEDFERLSIGQRSEQIVDPASFTPGLVLLKRPADYSISHDSRQQANVRGSPKNRHTKAVSGGPTGDAEYGRSRKPGTSKRLFDPQNDRTSFGRNNPNFTSQSHDSKGQPQRSSKKEQVSGQGSQPWLNFASSQPGKSEIISTQARSGNGGAENLTPVDIKVDQVDVAEDWDEEPELLLQPKTRPISHEQLVHEVKGIYAGLVMVETSASTSTRNRTLLLRNGIRRNGLS